MAELFDYLESRDDADELIAEFGQAVNLRRTATSGPAYDRHGKELPPMRKPGLHSA